MLNIRIKKSAAFWLIASSVGRREPKVSEECTASIFRMEEKAKKETSRSRR
jgi:hypothetical protein